MTDASTIENQLVALCREQAAQLPGALPADEVQALDQEVRALVPMLLGAVSREVGFSVSTPQVVVGNPEEIVATYARIALSLALPEQLPDFQKYPEEIARQLVERVGDEALARVIFDGVTPILVVNAQRLQEERRARPEGFTKYVITHELVHAGTFRNPEDMLQYKARQRDLIDKYLRSQDGLDLQALMDNWAYVNEAGPFVMEGFAELVSQRILDRMGMPDVFFSVRGLPEHSDDLFDRAREFFGQFEREFGLEAVCNCISRIDCWPDFANLQYADAWHAAISSRALVDGALQRSR